MCLTYLFSLSIARYLITVLVYHLGSCAAQWSNHCIIDICLSGGKKNAFFIAKDLFKDSLSSYMHCTVVVKGIKGWKGLDDTKIAK